MSHEININDYLMNPAHKIGRGSSGIVYRGRHRTTDVPVAIKRIDIRNLGSKMGRIWNEIQIMKSLTHPNIVRLYDIKIDLDKEYLYLIMEYCDSSDLSDYISEYTLDFTEIHLYFTQIKNGIQYLWERGIVHRDLKPHNLLLHQGAIKIADFGLSTILEKNGTLMQTMCGSPLYMSPEIIEHQKYTAKSDLWSLGVVLYQLIYHRHPLDQCQNLSELTKKMKWTQIQYPDHPPVDPLTMDLMQSLLSKNCHQRISWEEFFQHSWFTHYTHDLKTVSYQLGNTPPAPETKKIELPEKYCSIGEPIFSISIGSENEVSRDFDLTQFIMDDYQKKPSPTGKEDSHQSQTQHSHPGSRSGSRPCPHPTGHPHPTCPHPCPHPTGHPHPTSPHQRLSPQPGTSAPIHHGSLEYSPTTLNFGSIGGHISQTMIHYASQTFHWIKEGIDF